MNTVLNGHKAVQCDGCELWIHNECSFISEEDYENVLTTRCTWICPKCDFFNFSDSFFDDQLNLMTQNRFDPLSKDKNVGLSSKSSKETNSSNKTLGGLKLISININSIRGKKLDLLAFLEVHQPHVVAIQETKIDSSDNCNFGIVPRNMSVQCIQKGQKPSRWRGDASHP